MVQDSPSLQCTKKKNLHSMRYHEQNYESLITHDQGRAHECATPLLLTSLFIFTSRVFRPVCKYVREIKECGGLPVKSSVLGFLR